jgi:hypothetical protein
MSFESLPATHYIVRNGYTINFFKKGVAVNNNEAWDEAIIKSGFAGSTSTMRIKSADLLRSLEPVLEHVFKRGAQAHASKLMRMLKYGEQ